MSNEIIEFNKTGNELQEFFTSKEDVKTLVEKIREKVLSESSDDVSTATSRKYIAGLAYKVAQTKTAIDDAGKKLVADLKELPKKIDESRKEIREALDLLKEEVRKPLSDWEEEQKKEKERLLIIDGKIKDMSTNFQKAMGLKSSQIEIFLKNLSEIDFSTFGEREKEAREIHSEQLKVIAEYLETTKQAEKAKELEEQEKKRVLEAEIRKSAEEKAARDAELAILKAKQAEEFAKKQKEEAEARAIKAEQEAKERAEKAAEQARFYEIQRQEAEKERLAKEEARKEADKEYKIKIYLEITADLVDAGIPEEWAKACIKAVNQGKVKHLKVIL